MRKQLVLVTGEALLLVVSTSTQQNPVQWGDATAEKMSHFLRHPGAGLVPHTPRGRQTDNQVAARSGYSGNFQPYQPAAAEQLWAFDDPPLFRQVPAARKELGDLDQARMEDAKSHRAQRNALANTSPGSFFRWGKSKNPRRWWTMPASRSC